MTVAVPGPTATPETMPRPDPSPSYGPPIRLVIPRIRLDADVMGIGVRGDEYDVPGWAVGHHADSGNPGERGNSVFNGHLRSLFGGQVFARLQELEAGDVVDVYTPTHRLEWRVGSVHTASNTERWFISPTEDVRITLYTCTGTFDEVARDWSHRLAVVGELASVAPHG